MEHVVLAEGIGHGECLAFASHCGHGDGRVGHVGRSEVEVAGDDVGFLSLQHELEALVCAVKEGHVLGVSRAVLHLDVMTYITLDDSLLDCTTLGVEGQFYFLVL